MKKNLIALACFAGIASLVSCQKEMLQNRNSEVQKGQVISLKVNDDAAVKSAFDGDNTISLTGDEIFYVVYVDSEGIAKDTIKANPSETKGSYTFTVPQEITVSDYNWYAISPACQPQTKLGTTKDHHATLNLSPVQIPGANTFDPHYDYLLSNKFTVSEGSATIDQFKRLAAPLCLAVNGLEPGDKIYAVTLTLNEEPAANTGLVGQLKVKFSENFSESGTQSISCRGNGVSAIYANGLEAINNEWPVWFMVNPTALTSGESMTVSVTTATKTYTRTVSLPGASNLGTSSISKINFNAKGANYSEKNTIFQAFTESSVASAIAASAAPSLTASNGNAYTWSFSRKGCAMQDKEIKDGMPYGVQLSAPSGTGKFMEVPSFNGKTVTSVSLFMHSSNYTSATGTYYTSSEATATIAAGVKLSNATLGNQGGVSTLELPSEIETLAGAQLRPTATVNIAAALFEVADQAHDSNDYWDMYQKDVDFKIGDQVINRTNYPDAVCRTKAELKAADITGSTLLFLDNSESVGFEYAGLITFASGKVVIGRYKNKTQPVLSQTKTGSYYFRPNNSYFKNVRMESAGTANFVSAAATVCSFVCEDCTICCAGTLLREGNYTTVFGDVIFNNCVIENNGNGLISASGYNSKSGTPGGDTVLGTENKIEFNNCVVSTKSSDGTSMNPVAKNILDFSASTADTTSISVAIVLTGNTFVGFGGITDGAALVYSKAIGSFKINNNIFVGNWTSGKTNRVLKTTKQQNFKPDPRSISNNYGMMNGTIAISATNGDSQKRWNSDDHTKALSFTDTGNIWDSAASPFTSEDYTNLYFPVNTAVVTNGAGATYNTKLWRNWTGTEPTATSEGFHPVN